MPAAVTTTVESIITVRFPGTRRLAASLLHFHLRHYVNWLAFYSLLKGETPS